MRMSACVLTPKQHLDLNMGGIWGYPTYPHLCEQPCLSLIAISLSVLRTRRWVAEWQSELPMVYQFTVTTWILWGFCVLRFYIFSNLPASFSLPSLCFYIPKWSGLHKNLECPDSICDYFTLQLSSHWTENITFIHCTHNLRILIKMEATIWLGCQLCYWYH